MSAVPRPEDFPELSVAEWTALEDRVRAFEASWVEGRRPRLADFCNSEDTSGGQLLVELVHTELELRLGAGESARVEEYLATYPELAVRPRVIADLLGTEYRIRRRDEPGVTVEEYRQRFPGIDVDLEAPPEVATEEPRLSTNGVAAHLREPLLDDAGLPSVPGYELIEELGRGGMGIVYKAVDLRLNRTVAVKTLHAGGGPDERERLRREAEAAAELQHPNIVPVFQIVEHAGQLFVVTEYLRGGTLADQVGSPLPARQAARLLEPVARAAAFAHAQGIVHRDLKPSNVLLSADSTPKIGDFGLSKRIDEDSALTRTGVVTGSPCYMAPEQTAARRDVGPVADVYALGVLLYELLTGRPPFKGTDVLETLELARSSDPVPPRRLVPGTPRDLETVCLKCLEKEPRKRYADAAALVEDLARFCRGEPVAARPVGPLGRGTRWVCRNPSQAIAWGLFFSALFAGTTGSLWQAAEAKAIAKVASESEHRVRKLLFASDMRLAAEAIHAEDATRAAELLEAHADVKGGQAFVRNHLARLAHVPRTQIDLLGGPAYFICFSPDEKTLAACGAPGEIRFYDTQSWKPIRRISAGQGELNGLAFAPDGTTLASAGDDGSVVLWDLKTGHERWRVKLYQKQAFQPVFALEGSLLAVCGNEPEIHLLDPADGGIERSFCGDERNVEGITVTPDGTTLLSAGCGGRASAWDAATGSERWRVDHPTNDQGRLISVTCSPDGRTAAFGCSESTVLLVDAVAGRVIHQGPLPSERPAKRGGGHKSIGFLRNDLLAVSSDTGSVRLVGYGPDGLTTVPERAVTAWNAHDTRIGGLAVSSSGILVSGDWDGQLVAWMPNAPPARMPIDAGQGANWHKQLGIRTTASIVGDGYIGESRRVAVVGTDSVHLVEPWTGKKARLPGPMEHPAALLASKDGRRLFVGGGAGEISAWDLGSSEPRLVWRHQLPGISVVDLYAMPDEGTWVAALLLGKTGPWQRDHRIAVFDTTSGRLLCERTMHAAACAPVTPADGSVLASALHSVIVLMDPRTLESRSELIGHQTSVKALAFSQDGRLLASADLRRLILWNIETSKPIREWKADVGIVNSLDFTPDGTVLVTATVDQAPRFWDVETGRLLLSVTTPPPERDDDVWSSAFFDPGGHMVIFGRGRSVMLLNGSPILKKGHSRPFD